MNKRLTQEQASIFATQLRSKAGLNENEPIHIKSLLLKLGLLTRYRPLSENAYGLSLQSTDKRFGFMLINSNSTRGRQHFTAAHELYHLYFDINPKPHICTKGGDKPSAEKDADLFASNLLMPSQGIINEIPAKEIREGISIATILRLEQLFSVSHEAMVYRLKSLSLINESKVESLLALSISEVARDHGYNLDLYQGGNENTTIGNFGSNARRLYESEKISESHYLELLSLISDDKQEGKNSIGC